MAPYWFLQPRSSLPSPKGPLSTVISPAAHHICMLLMYTCTRTYMRAHVQSLIRENKPSHVLADSRNFHFRVAIIRVEKNLRRWYCTRQ